MENVIKQSENLFPCFALNYGKKLIVVVTQIPLCCKLY